MQLPKCFFAYIPLACYVVTISSLEHPACPQHLWNLSFDGIKDEGHATLDIKVHNHLESDASGRVVLSCEDILVGGTGENTFHISQSNKTIKKFNISLPEPVTESDHLLLEQDKTHTCVLSLLLTSSSCEGSASERCPKHNKECTIGIRTFIGRILPLCGHTHQEDYVSNVKIFKDEGKVHVHLGTSPSEVLAFDPHCAIHDEIGHNSSSSMSEYTFPLNEERSGPVILSVEFRPNCSDRSVVSNYQDIPMTGCKLGMHRYCQQGTEKMGDKEIPFAQSAKFCYAPPSLRDIIASALKFHFGVDSVPVIVEIIWLICNALLYLLLAPLAFYKCILRPRLIPKLIPGSGRCSTGNTRTYSVLQDKEIERIIDAMDDREDPPCEDVASRTVDGERSGEAVQRKNIVEVELHETGGF